MTYHSRFWFQVLFGCLVLGAFLAVPPAASAQYSGPTTTGDVCMQKLYGYPITTNNRLNCTAQDIKIAKALSATCTGPGCLDATSCKLGQTFDLTATFQVNVTANARYDAGFYFDISGDPENDGAYTGTCSLSTLDRTIAPALNLDGDFCGDLNTGSYTNVTFTIPGVLCTGDANNQLRLPNCVSWHSSAKTACNQITDAFPETKAKCNCDIGFVITGIRVVPPAGFVAKQASQAVVTYAVAVHNTSAKDATLVSLSDNVYGNIADGSNPAIASTTCSAGGLIAANDSIPYSCSFTVLVPYPGSASAIHDVVTATLSNNDGTAALTGSATVVVDLNAPAP